MIGWSDINPVLKEICTECALDATRSAEGFTAEWKDGPRSFTSTTQKLSLLMKVTRVASVGEDETRSTTTTVGDVTTVTESQTGQRKVTLQLQAVVPEHTDEQWAMATLERIRMRLRRPRIIERLLDLDVSLIGIGDAIDSPFRDRGRVVSAATMEVFLGAVANEDDPIPSNWIQYLVISSRLSEGTTLPPGQQMVDVEVPTIPTA
jgi:hypothetical protein